MRLWNAPRSNPKMPRTHAKHPFRVGSIVQTPTRKRAKVIGYYMDGRVELRYCETGPGMLRDYEVALAPDLLRPINDGR